MHKYESIAGNNNQDWTQYLNIYELTIIDELQQPVPAIELRKKNYS